jgi:DNA replication ATP-dependent helicase Dna2
MKSIPIAPGSQTRTKLKAFQFIEGKPSVVDDAEKENDVQKTYTSKNPQETPVKGSSQAAALAAPRNLPPSTPATRLPLADLIGNPDESRSIAQNATPEENVLWRHAQTPSSSHPATTPARKRKRARSSSPVTSSQNEQSNFFEGNKESFDVQGLQASLKTPQADPAADLWNRYAINASANDGETGTKSVAFAHLIKDASPRSSGTAGSVSGLRRWASCGVEWPASTTKRRRISRSKQDQEQRGDGEEQSDNDVPKISKVGLLLERMKETLQQSQETCPQGPSSSSPIPDRVAYELESPTDRLAPVAEYEDEDSRGDVPVPEHKQVQASPIGSMRKMPKSQSSSSEYGGDDMDMDMIEAIECTITGIQSQSQALSTIVEVPQIDNTSAHSVAQSIQKASRPSTTPSTILPRQDFDEFDEEDDDMFAADLEEIASKFDSQVAQDLSREEFQQPMVPKANVGGAVMKAPPANVETIVIEDEFGDDDFDDEELAAAEIAATQAFQETYSASASVCTRSIIG